MVCPSDLQAGAPGLHGRKPEACATRELTPADLPATFALIVEAERHPRLDIAWLRQRTFGDPTSTPDLLLIAEADARVVGYCFACLRDGRGNIKAFGVAEGYRRRGVATALFDAMEPRLRAQGVTQITVEGVGPNFFWPGVELIHTEAISFLLHRGYETDRVARVDMAVDLLHTDLDTAEQEAALAAQGLTLRRARPEEIASVAQFALAHFNTAWPREVSDAAFFTPTPLFAAWDRGQVVSFAAYDVGGPARFGPTGTHPDYRRKGLGGTLLKLCLRDLRARGENLAEIAWAGPVAYYARAVNARIHRTYWLFRKALS